MDTSREFFEAHFGSPEMLLLLAGCRRLAGSIGEEEWRRRIRSPFDETLFFDLCRRNRLSLVIKKELVGPCKDRFSPDIAEGFEREARRLALGQLHLSKTLVEVHESFRTAGIRHVFLKGPVLGGILFGTEILRSSGDLDVLIEPRNIKPAIAAMEKAGFSTITPRKNLHLDYPFFKTRHKDIAFRKNGAGPAVEMHWKTEKVEAIVDRGIFDWDAHVEFVRIQGRDMPALEDCHNCLYLCLHAAKHNWTRLQWLLDIALLMRRREIDCGRLFALAGIYGLENVVREAIYLCGRLLNVRFGGGNPPSDEHATALFRRFHLALRPYVPGTGFLLALHRSRLYPQNGPRQKFLAQWMVANALSRARRVSAHG